MLPCVCSVIDHRGGQNVVRTSVTHSAAPRVPLFCSYHILTSSVIYYWTDARQHGIYLLTRCLAFATVYTLLWPLVQRWIWFIPFGSNLFWYSTLWASSIPPDDVWSFSKWYQYHKLIERQTELTSLKSKWSFKVLTAYSRLQRGSNCEHKVKTSMATSSGENWTFQRGSWRRTSTKIPNKELQCDVTRYFKRVFFRWSESAQTFKWGIVCKQST